MDVTLTPQDQSRRRRKARITQAEVARRLGVAVSSVVDYEAGRAGKRGGVLPWGNTPQDYEHALQEIARSSGVVLEQPRSVFDEARRAAGESPLRPIAD